MKEIKITGYHLNFGLDNHDRSGEVHYDNFCLIYIRSGNGSLILNQNNYKLSKGQCFLAPIGQSISYRSEGKERWQYLWFLFNGPIFQEIIPRTAFSLNNPVAICSEEQTAFFEELYSKRNEFQSGGYYDALGLTVRLLASFIKSFPSDTQLLSDGSTRSILDFIQSNLHRPDLSVTLLSSITGLGRTTLYAKFKRRGLPSPAVYIRDLRITKAKNLLRTTDLPVAQVAFAVGFEDALYFSRLFKQRIGRPPTEFRSFFNKSIQTKK